MKMQKRVYKGRKGFEWSFYLRRHDHGELPWQLDIEVGLGSRGWKFWVS